MNIKDLFEKPLNRSINGVVKADQNDDITVYQELDEYVVTNELEKHFRSFFESYATDLNDPSIANRVGVWISGFFGSGKSHFLKTLSYILANKIAIDKEGRQRAAVEFFDEKKVQDALIRADIIKAVNHHSDVILFNIDSKASSNDQGNPILNVFLRVFNEYQGFSGDHAHIAHMERHLQQKGLYQTFQDAFEQSSGSSWLEERDGYQFYQDDIEYALMQALGLSQEAAHKWFEESEGTFSVSVENFCEWVKEYLESKGSQQRILFLVDEVGQFIGSDTRLMLTLQTITENLGTICQGRAWVVVTSQADMDAVLGELSSSKANDFSKIAGRFKTRLSLSSSNTDEVIQKRLLRKTPEAIASLQTVFANKGDILKNQISFDRSGPNLKNFEDVDSFVNNYPFVPYHFQLVQKVFEEIRKIGATGAHLAYGERSMLDAFQLAAQSIATDTIGSLVPFHKFYHSVEGFLDTAVKRTIDQANENTELNELDVQNLRTLFMIRYVDIIKGTLDNLVTLSISEIDEDKLALRQRIEESLGCLEKQSLITRNGDEFLFLTNEERDISRQIKAVELSSSEENRELFKLLFKDVLRDQNKYFYPVNKVNYPIGRYLDAHTLDNRSDSELKVEIISPLDPDYNYYKEVSYCIAKSTRSEDGQVLIILEDDKQFFNELKTWLKTIKFIQWNSDSNQTDITRILSERGRENLERKKRLNAHLKDLFLAAKVYALGQELSVSQTSADTKLNEACQYLLENTYNKLNYLQVYQEDPLRELNALLNTDDVQKPSLGLEYVQNNPKATKEIEEFIDLLGKNSRVLISDIIDRHAKKPYGWPDNEILLIIGQLAFIGRISLQFKGSTLPLDQAFDVLKNSKVRREVSVFKKHQTDGRVLKAARDLTRELFTQLGPNAEKELFDFYQQRFQEWLQRLKNYQTRIAAGHFPGKELVSKAISQLQTVLSIHDNSDFFKTVVDHKDDYLDLEEDYRIIDEFFNHQWQIWENLQQALRRFELNKDTLMRNEEAKSALTQLKTIYQNVAPYGQLSQVAALISKVDQVNNRLLGENRQEAFNIIDENIKKLQFEIENSGIATPALSNQLLAPLQGLKQQVESIVSIADIYMLQNQTVEDYFDQALAELESCIESERERQKPVNPSPTPVSTVTGTEAEVISAPIVPSVIKPVVDVNVSAVYNKVAKGAYLETEESVDQFIESLKQELKNIVRSEKRVRIRS